MNLPLALPGSFGHGVEGWVQAVCVVANITVITKQKAPRVTGLSTRLAHCALKTAPPFGQDHPCDLMTVTQ